MRVFFFLVFIGVLCGCDDPHESPPQEELQSSYYFIATLKDQTGPEVKEINVKYKETLFENVSFAWGSGTNTFDPEHMSLSFVTIYPVNGLNGDEEFNITFQMHERKIDIDSVNHTYLNDTQMLDKFNYKDWEFLYSQTSGYDRGIILRFYKGDKSYINFKNDNGSWSEAINNDEPHHFTLDRIEPKFDVVHGDGFVVNGTFDCVLYNYEDPSDSVTITNGAFQGFIARKNS